MIVHLKNSFGILATDSNCHQGKHFSNFRRLFLQLPGRMQFQLKKKRSDRGTFLYQNNVTLEIKLSNSNNVDLLVFTAVQHGIVPFRQMVEPMPGHVTDRQRQFFFGRNFVRNCPDWTNIRCINALSIHLRDTVEVKSCHRKNVRNPL